MGLFVILQKVFARKNVVVDKKDMGAFGLCYPEITGRRSALTLSMKNPEPITDLQLFQPQAGIVGGPVVDDEYFEL